MRVTRFGVLIALSLAIVAYAVAAYTFFPLGAAVHPDMRATFEAHDRLAIYTHVFLSALALSLGPFQFMTGLRTKRPALHRWSGRVYVIAVLIGGLSGLFVAFNAFGGLVARVGFSCLAIGWLFTGARAYLAIRAGDIATHRAWMVRNFALTFAAVTLRFWLPGLVVVGFPMAVAYPIIGWLCWVPNLVVAELILQSQQPAPKTEVRVV